MDAFPLTECFHLKCTWVPDLLSHLAKAHPWGRLDGSVTPKGTELGREPLGGGDSASPSFHPRDLTVLFLGTHCFLFWYLNFLLCKMGMVIVATRWGRQEA